MGGLPLFNKAIGNPQGQCSRCKAKELALCYGVQVKDDEPSGESQQGNKKDDVALDDALLARDHILERMVELQGDQ